MALRHAIEQAIQENRIGREWTKPQLQQIREHLINEDGNSFKPAAINSIVSSYSKSMPPLNDNKVGEKANIQCDFYRIGKTGRNIIHCLTKHYNNQNNATTALQTNENNTELYTQDLIQEALNQILYGPPGTGKTYNTVTETLKILGEDQEELPEYSEQKKLFDDYKLKGQINFVTFHQSFSYEDFVEGISAEINANGELSYSIKDGIFKKIAIEALFSKFKKQYDGQLSNKWQDVKDKTPKIKLDATGIDKDTDFDNNNDSHKKLILSTHKVSDFESSKGEPYVLIIDEINRGNTSRVFGELITLIETTKRAGSDEAMDAILPYSQEKFTVPDNLYIIGTMNTADRSLALMDTALRRRFDFIEMMPMPELIKDINIVEIDFERMLKTINDRIEALYDREHTIGHAFFMTLKDDSTIEKLASIFKNNILPLLEEYFFEDWDKIIKILGDSNIYTQKNSANLGFTHTGKNYSRNYASLENPQTYINIYTSKANNTNQDQTA
jgi:5-methylcytosine-specific restriction enzyme B